MFFTNYKNQTKLNIKIYQNYNKKNCAKLKLAKINNLKNTDNLVMFSSNISKKAILQILSITDRTKANDYSMKVKISGSKFAKKYSYIETKNHIYFYKPSICLTCYSHYNVDFFPFLGVLKI